MIDKKNTTYMTIPNVGGHFSPKVLQNSTPITEIHWKPTYLKIRLTSAEKQKSKPERENSKLV